MPCETVLALSTASPLFLRPAPPNLPILLAIYYDAHQPALGTLEKVRLSAWTLYR